MRFGEKGDANVPGPGRGTLLDLRTTRNTRRRMLKTSLRQQLHQVFTDQELKRWFDPLTLALDESQKRLDVSFPHSFFGAWFGENVRDRFEEELARILGPDYTMHYGEAAGNPARPARAQAQRATSTEFPFGRQFTLENFLVNSKNYFPLASAKELVKQREAVFNPFTICGESGSGKTHLLRALGNELARDNRGKRVFLGSIEDLDSVYKAGANAYAVRNRLLEYDYLLVDDFQHIRSNLHLQDELVGVFNAFYDARKQMVFACADKVAAYDFLDPKLKSRLEWGLIVNLVRPDLDIRVRYIQNQCKLKKIQLSQEQMLLLAQRFTDFRFLQGILLKMFAYRELVSKDIRDKDFRQILSHTEDRVCEPPSAKRIIEVVAEHFGIPIKEITGDKRHQEVVQARQVAMYLCRQMLGASYPTLGREFGGKDHSTVLYAVKKIKRLQSDNKDLKRLLMELRHKCANDDENDADMPTGVLRGR